MIITVDLGVFIDRFNDFGRGGTFSFEAKEALFDYYEGLEEDLGEQIELDVIGICCEWCEYKSTEEALKEYGLSSLEELEENTTVILLDSGSVLVRGW